MNTTPTWITLPPTPILPNPDQSGHASVNGVKIWYALFGRGEPVILLHGGLSSSNYWGNQVPALAKYYLVIVMDSRGQGRSSWDARPFSYDLMASDVDGLMDYLTIRKAAIVGWSDGAIVGLLLAIHQPERLTKLFAFGANSNPSAVKPGIVDSPVFKESVVRRESEYRQLSPAPEQWNAVRDQIRQMQKREPNLTAEQLRGITVPTWIVAGDHEEAIKREDTLFLADHIPGAGLLVQPGVSHLAFLHHRLRERKRRERSVFVGGSDCIEESLV